MLYYEVLLSMRAIVLAGGHATRLWPITRNRAKPLLPLDGRPIIDYIVAELEDDPAVEEIYISTNRKFAPDFEAYIDERGYSKSEVVVEDQESEEEKPGTIGAILKLLAKKGDDDYLIIGGDNYYSFSITSFLDVADGRPTIACFDVGTRERATSFGVVEADDDGMIVDFEEKPDDPDSTLASTACYFFPEHHIDLFRRYEEYFREETDVPADRYLDEPGRLVEWAHRQTDMFAFPFQGNWFDVGTREGYLEAQRKVADGAVVEGDVRSSDLGDHVYVMEGATVVDSELSDCIVFPEARIEGSSVDASIVDQQASLSNVDLTGSLVGEHSQLRR
jgi:glucose-1-phosphate thymidylyltransferase